MIEKTATQLIWPVREFIEICQRNECIAGITDVVLSRVRLGLVGETAGGASSLNSSGQYSDASSPKSPL